MEKYELLKLQLIHRGIVSKNHFFEPTTQRKYDFSIHNEAYLDRLFEVNLSKAEERASGFKQSKQLIKREVCITNGTIEAAIVACKHNLGFNIAGGTHHALSNRPEGFCLLNDQAIAANYLIKNNLAKRVLIIDLDVHQGNGTAEILKDENRIFTFSMHGAKNYPNHKPPSDLDIPLSDLTTDEEYLDKLTEGLLIILSQFKPDFVFFQAGVDVLATDKLGRLSLTLEGCKKRDEIVFEFCKNNNLPVVITMGGGYSSNINIILEAHTNTFITALNTYT